MSISHLSLYIFVIIETLKVIRVQNYFQIFTIVL